MTRKFLQGLGVEGDAVDKIMDANGADIEREKAVSDSLRDEMKLLKSEASEAKKALKEAEDIATTEGASLKAKLDAEEAAHAETKKAMKDAVAAEKEAHEATKSGYESEKAKAEKHSALLKQLSADGADPKLINLIEKEFDLEKIELDEGKIKDWESLSKPIKEQYAEVFKIEQRKDFEPGKPAPDGGGPSLTVEQVKSMTPAEINKNWTQVQEVLKKG